MGVKFRAMTEQDYFDLGRFIRHAGNNDTFDQLSGSLDSSSIFGSSDGFSKAVEQQLERLHRRAAIALVLPTFNYVLARANASFLWRLLGVDSSIGLKIVNMEVVYDLNKKDFVDINEVKATDKYLMGAKIAEQLIEEFNFEKEVEGELFRAVKLMLSDGEIPRDYCEIVQGDGDFALCGNYYLNVTDPAGLSVALKRGYSIESVQQNLIDNVLRTGDSRLTYLLNMNRDKSGLHGMLNYYVAVVPPEMRPKVQFREHKLTTRYTSILTANSELRAVLGVRANPLDLQSKYLLLDRAVSKMQYKNVGTSKNVAPDDLAMLERVKGKKGQIRLRNLGKRTDYTGRAVVVINPYLPLDMIKLPKSMLPAILQFHVLPYLAQNIKSNNKSKEEGDIYSTIYDRIKITDLQDVNAQNEIINIITKHKLLEKIPIHMGRQPTLHKLGVQAFYCDFSDSNAIEVNPLVCTAYNMDFDGDTAWDKVPLREGSIDEARNLVLTTQNLYLPKTGECTIEPRQEMLYGLYVATRSTYRKGKPVDITFDDLSAVREAVIAHKIKCWDTVVLNSGKTYIAGEAAFISCFPEGDVIPSDEIPKKNQIPVCEITSKTITHFINHVLRTGPDGHHIHHIGTRYASTQTFTGCINHIVELGFKLAYIYTPSVSMIKKDPVLPSFDNALDSYYAEIDDYDFLYDMGFMNSEDYRIEFNRILSKLNKAMSDNIYEKLGDDNGYVLMAKSGARGKQANLTQMFGIKGMVKKNNNEAFDALLTDCYQSQLTPQVHFIAAYGARQGQMDKSLKTGDVGYATRKMWQATQGIIGRVDDCGTTDGLTITKDYFTRFIDPDSKTFYEELHYMFEHAIVGRYTCDGEMISEVKAHSMSIDPNIMTVKIRSPLTCKDPCCVKCYGIDWSLHRKVVKGTACGIDAAHSIGEPTTQLTMNTFHSGGVANSGVITSAFDKVNAYIHCTDLASATKKGRYAGYDPIAWADGEVIEMPGSNVTEKKVYIGEPKGKRIILPVGVRLRTHATKGEGLSYKHGDYSIPELLAYCGIKEAQKYVIYKLYSLYKNECDIMMIHFECLVASMTRHMIIKTDRKDLYVGQYCTTKELHSGPLDGTMYESRLLSVKELPQVSQEACDTILMENHGLGLSRACALGLADTLEKPLNRMLFGLTINHGSRVPGYVEERKDLI